MGREIRRVPKGWEHPSKHMNPWEMDNFYHRYHKPGEFDYGLKFQPMYDNDFESKLKEWLEGYEQWKKGEHPYQVKNPDVANEPFWEYKGAPPDPHYYRPAWKPEEMTHYQIYETVSEGTPTSPVFETLDEMRVWLIGQGYSERAAAGFVKSGYVPSAVFSQQTGLVSGIEVAGIDFGDDGEGGDNG